jgi:hypothetical protein
LLKWHFLLASYFFEDSSLRLYYTERERKREREKERKREREKERKKEREKEREPSCTDLTLHVLDRFTNA